MKIIKIQNCTVQVHTFQPSKIRSSYLQRPAETYSFSCAISHVASCFPVKFQSLLFDYVKEQFPYQSVSASVIFECVLLSKDTHYRNKYEKRLNCVHIIIQACHSEVYVEQQFKYKDIKLPCTFFVAPRKDPALLGKPDCEK